MGIVFRQSVKTSIVVLGGALLGGLIIWLSTKYIPDQQQFGFTRTLTNQAVTLSQILLFGLSSTLFVFTHRYATDTNKRNALFTICITLPLVIVAVVSVFYVLFKGWILNHYQPADKPLMAEYFMWLPAYTLLFLYMTILEQYLGSQMKVAVSAFMREIVLRVLNIILIILFAFNIISFHTLVVGSVLIYLEPILVYLYLSMQVKDFRFLLNLKIFSLDEYKEMLHFTWYHFLLSISVTLLGTMDILLIPFYNHAGIRLVAIYAVAVYIISFLQIPAKAFLPASFSILTKAFTDNDLVKAKDLFIRSSLNLIIPTTGIAILLLCNMNNAVAIVGTGKNYADIVPVFQVLLLGRMFDIATGMNDQVLSITNYYKFNFYLSLILIVVLYALIRIFVPGYGVVGAAWSTTTAIIIFNTIKCIFVWKKLGMQPFSRRTIIVIICGAVAFIPGYLIPAIQNPILDGVVRSIIIIITYLIMLVWLKPSNDLVEYIASVLKNKRLF